MTWESAKQNEKKGIWVGSQSHCSPFLTSAPALTSDISETSRSEGPAGPIHTTRESELLRVGNADLWAPQHAGSK